MPPRVYVPDDPWDVQYSKTAFKNGVLEGDVEHVIFLPRHRLKIFGGRASDHDVDFSGGDPSNVLRPTFVRATLPDGHRMEVGLRRDFRYKEEVCYVFHARYL